MTFLRGAARGSTEGPAAAVRTAKAHVGYLRVNFFELETQQKLDRAALGSH
jgi:hypothetical protein